MQEDSLFFSNEQIYVILIQLTNQLVDGIHFRVCGLFHNKFLHRMCILRPWQIRRKQANFQNFQTVSRHNKTISKL